MNALSLRIRAAMMIAAGFLFSPVTAGAAAVMDFETALPGSLLTATYEQNGIRLTVLTGHYDIWQCGVDPFIPACTGRVAGIDETMAGPSSVRISLVNGAPFDLTGMEVLTASSDDSMSASNGALLTFVGGPGSLNLAAFRGIQYVDLNSRGLLPGFLFDNLQMQEIPEPASWGLLLLGGVLAGRWLGFRR